MQLHLPKLRPVKTPESRPHVHVLFYSLVNIEICLEVTLSKHQRDFSRNNRDLDEWERECVGVAKYNCKDHRTESEKEE